MKLEQVINKMNALAFAGVLFVFIILKGIMSPNKSLCLGSSCVSFAQNPFLAIGGILIMCLVFYAGILLGLFVLRKLFSQQNPYLIVGIFLVAVAIGLFTLSFVNAETQSDQIGFIVLASFVGIVGAAMVICPLIWPEKYWKATKSKGKKKK